MRRRVTLAALIENIGHQYDIKWLSGEIGRNTPLIGDMPGDELHKLVGPLNSIQPNRIQIIGRTELTFLHALSREQYQDTLDRLFEGKPAAILFSSDLTPAIEFFDRARDHEIALLGSPLSEGVLISNLRYHLSHALAESVTVHGVMMEVLGRGVLLTGKPGIGKSELALDLISRGHRLISDDAPILTQVNPDILNSSCPYVLQDFLEVRGLGILNIREMFGDSAVRPKKNLHLNVHLEEMTGSQLANVDRIQGSNSEVEILRVQVSKVVVPVAPGRNMAILVETAVRQYMLRQRGYDSAAAFIQQQKKVMVSNS
ncbi:MAG: HPr(Ser) kinase/phosphatase [Candidatus Polarisedimenticolaceae bacterium]|nr:HPr(Ser) kinase/phosphatase [Candidatus Polarisedimenticolaceae bacterium]